MISPNNLPVLQENHRFGKLKLTELFPKVFIAYSVFFRVAYSSFLRIAWLNFFLKFLSPSWIFWRSLSWIFSRSFYRLVELFEDRLVEFFWGSLSWIFWRSPSWIFSRSFYRLVEFFEDRLVELFEDRLVVGGIWHIPPMGFDPWAKAHRRDVAYLIKIFISLLWALTRGVSAHKRDKSITLLWEVVRILSLSKQFENEK